MLFLMATTRLSDVLPERKQKMPEANVEAPKPIIQASLAECNKSFMANAKRRLPVAGHPIGQPMEPQEALAAIQRANERAAEIVAEAERSGEQYAAQHAEAKIKELTLEAARELVAEADAAAETATPDTEETNEEV